MSNTPPTIDAYIANFSPEVQAILQQIRATIRAAAPEAQEIINYQIPTFTLRGRNLVHFAALQHHIGFYPTPSGMTHFWDELSGYKRAKGSVQFPLAGPMPYEMIAAITRFRVAEVEAGAKSKA